MNNKTGFQDSYLLALTTACLAMAAFGCSKSDSLGSVRDAGTDGIGKDGNGCQSPGANPSTCDTPPAPDSSPDRAPDGIACGAGVLVHYSAPGCGADAVPICGAYNQDACTAVISYCACDGQTTVYGACGTSPSPFLYLGACQSVADAPPDTGCQYPLDSHVDATGNAVWWWRFHWQDQNLATTCAAWGADAKMILEVDVPANPSGSGTALPTCATDTLSTGSGPRCAMANSWRFETACTDGQLMVELPSSNVFHGYYHVESSAHPNSARHLVSQDDHCSRDLYLPTGLASPPVAPNDGGVDTAASDSPAAVFCQLSDGRRIEAGATFADVDGCNCCYCSPDGRAICQGAACLWKDGGGGAPTSCQTDQDCIAQGRTLCVFEPGCDSPHGSCMSGPGVCELISDYCGCDGVTYSDLVSSGGVTHNYPYKPYKHVGACP